jgi:hypothetical protein
VRERRREREREREREKERERKVCEREIFGDKNGWRER